MWKLLEEGPASCSCEVSVWVLTVFAKHLSGTMSHVFWVMMQDNDGMQGCWSGKEQNKRDFMEWLIGKMSKRNDGLHETKHGNKVHKMEQLAEETAIHMKGTPKFASTMTHWQWKNKKTWFWSSNWRQQNVAFADTCVQNSNNRKNHRPWQKCTQCCYF